MLKNYFQNLSRFLVGIKERVLCTELLSEKDRALVDDNNQIKKENDAATDVNEESKSKAVKLKGQNKNRPPPMKFDITEKICPSLIDVTEDEVPAPCPYSPTCRYRHDVIEYMKERKSDILPGGCYNYQTVGRCSRGISCLFGDEHVTPEGKNKENPKPTAPHSEYYNFLTKELQKTLRKKAYDFSKSDSVVKTVHKDQSKGKVVKVEEVQIKVPSSENPTIEGMEEPSAKKICLEKTGPITDEDIITLKAEEKKKVFALNFIYMPS